MMERTPQHRKNHKSTSMLPPLKLKTTGDDVESWLVNSVEYNEFDLTKKSYGNSTKHTHHGHSNSYSTNAGRHNFTKQLEDHSKIDTSVGRSFLPPINTTTNKDGSPTTKNYRAFVGIAKKAPMSFALNRKMDFFTSDRSPDRSLSPITNSPKSGLTSMLKENDKFRSKKTALQAIQIFKKKYVLATKIIKEYEADDVQNAIVPDVKDTPREEDLSTNRGSRQSLSPMEVDLKIHFLRVLDYLNSALNNVKDKKLFDRDLESAVDEAQASGNNELYKAVLKMQGKVMLTFGDIYKSLTTFKHLKKVGETKKDFFIKLLSYKYLGKCYQNIGNYRMAIFYYMKLLQMAWYCDKSRYELLAYDMIGLQYFYLGDIDKSKFYHNKMVEGRIEPRHSELRKLGINKLVLKMLEGPGPSKKDVAVTSLEEELIGYNIPLSEDDFELPLPEHQYVKKELKEGKKEQDEKNTAKKEFYDYKRLAALQKRKKEERNNKNGNIGRGRKQPAKEMYTLTSHTLQTEFDTEQSEHSTVYLSHMSPNRLVKNFNAKDAKDVVNDYLARGNGMEGASMALDGKAMELVKKKISKVKLNLEMALRRIKQIETIKISTQMITEEAFDSFQKTPMVKLKHMSIPRGF